MAQKKKVTATVISQKQIGEQIFDLWLETKLAKDAHPGQFVAVYPRGESMLLPRPHQHLRDGQGEKQAAAGVPRGRKGDG